jgi:hypothetical protein
MCPSTEATDAQREFAAEVLRNLLRHIDDQNGEAGDQFLVSHAWTDGPMMYLVYKAPPSDITWGLARDTRESMINPSPWQDVDEAVLYYYMLDFEEDWPGSSSHQPGEPDAIRWLGDQQAVFRSARQTSLRRIGIRHRQHRRQSAAGNEISPTSPIILADTQIHSEQPALRDTQRTFRCPHN